MQWYTWYIGDSAGLQTWTQKGADALTDLGIININYTTNFLTPQPLDEQGNVLPEPSYVGENVTFDMWQLFVKVKTGNLSYVGTPQTFSQWYSKVVDIENPTNTNLLDTIFLYDEAGNLEYYKASNILGYTTPVIGITVQPIPKEGYSWSDFLNTVPYELDISGKLPAHALATWAGYFSLPFYKNATPVNIPTQSPTYARNSFSQTGFPNNIKGNKDADIIFDFIGKPETEIAGQFQAAGLNNTEIFDTQKGKIFVYYDFPYGTEASIEFNKKNNLTQVDYTSALRLLSQFMYYGAILDEKTRRVWSVLAFKLEGVFPGSVLVPGTEWYVAVPPGPAGLICGKYDSYGEVISNMCHLCKQQIVTKSASVIPSPNSNGGLDYNHVEITIIDNINQRDGGNKLETDPTTSSDILFG